MSISAPKATETIWYKEPVEFLTNVDNIVKFIPDAKMTLVEQLNAAFRFALYFSVVVALIKQDVRVLFFAVFVALFTILVTYTEDQKHSKREGLMQELNVKYDRQKQPCLAPSKDNPYMNVLISDYKQFPNRPKACNIANKHVKKAINDFASDHMYKDVDDVFNRNASERQFFTNPITTIPNTQSEFAHWLYNNGTTCKEKSVACAARF